MLVCWCFNEKDGVGDELIWNRVAEREQDARERKEDKLYTWSESPKGKLPGLRNISLLSAAFLIGSNRSTEYDPDQEEGDRARGSRTRSGDDVAEQSLSFVQESKQRCKSNNRTPTKVVGAQGRSRILDFASESNWRYVYNVCICVNVFRSDLACGSRVWSISLDLEANNTLLDLDQTSRGQSTRRWRDEVWGNLI